MRIDSYTRPRMTATAMTANLHTGLLSRREALRFFGGASLATAGLLALGRRGAFAQEGGTPPAVATPQVGPQADGTTLWRVRVGAMMMEEGIEAHAFLPGEITINAGDSIWFEMGMPMFHTVTFLAGGPLPDLLIPDPEAGTPEAGALPKLILNPAVLFPSAGAVVDGTEFVNSGADFFRDPSQAFIVTFPTAGSFDYLCVPHGNVMQARVVVQEAGSALPLDQAGVDAKADEETAEIFAIGAAELAQYAEATSTARDDGTTLWEATVGAGGETKARVQRILPATLEIKVGDTVKWINRSPGEPHTVTFVGSDTTPPEDSIVEQFADGSPKFVQNMETFLPQGGNVFSGTGFVNSGFTGIPQLGLPMEWECTFDTPGEYIPYCILHGDSAGNRMAAKLVVTPR